MGRSPSRGDSQNEHCAANQLPVETFWLTRTQSAWSLNPLVDMQPSESKRTVKIEVLVRGMNCQNCARAATKALQLLPGIQSVVVRLDEQTATLECPADARPSPELILSTIREAGFAGSFPNSGSGTSPLTAEQEWRRSVILGLAFTIPMVLGEWVFSWGHHRWFQWVTFVLALPVQAFAGARFYVGAWRQIQAGRSSMDTLVALGSSTAFAYSLIGLVLGKIGHTFFMEAAAIITFISLGHWLEGRATAQATRALRALLELTPPQATLLENGQESTVAADTLRPGHRILVRPGERVPADASIQEGISNLDESMLTGESMPMVKSAGATIYGGTMNLDGQLVALVTRTGADAALGQIIQAVERAQSSRAQVQRLADAISNVFVPIVVLLAILCGLGWAFAYPTLSAWQASLSTWLWPGTPFESPTAAAFINAASILIVACPCALGLATPTAIMAAANVAAKLGILIRDGRALEKSGAIDTIVFDKTRTLTLGRPTLVFCEELRPSPETPGFPWAQKLAQASSHPLAKAIAAAPSTACNRPTSEPATPVPSLRQIKEIPGCGMAAIADSEGGQVTIRLGSLDWLRRCHVTFPPFHGKAAEALTMVGFSVDNRLVTLFGLRDQLRPEAGKTVASLQRSGLKVYMLSGDQTAVAEAIAQELGLPKEGVMAEVTPEQKAATIQKMQAAGARVAFVGDGINDAAALQQADLGIAVGEASDVARESADLVLLRSDLGAVAEALHVSRKALRTIRQNLFWAFFYNAAAIPLAGLGLLHPALCALAMGVSDLFVIGNALRLLKSARPKQVHSPA